MKCSVLGARGGVMIAAAVVAMGLLARPAVAGGQAGGLPELAAQVAALKAQLGTLQASNTALQTQLGSLQTEVDMLQADNAALQARLACVAGDSDSHDVYFEGCNVHVLNGEGKTDSVNSYGNLIIGYNETSLSSPQVCSDGAYDNQGDCKDNGGTWGANQKSGSHTLVVGAGHSYTRFGGMVVGFANTVNGGYASVSGGLVNVASGDASSVTGGSDNTASGTRSSISGGSDNTANGRWSIVSGGLQNTASGGWSSVSGGESNTASGYASSVIGGQNNEASMDYENLP